MLPPVASGASATVTSFALPALPPIPSPTPATETDMEAETEAVTRSATQETVELSVGAPVTHTAVDSVPTSVEKQDSVVLKVETSEQVEEAVAQSLPKATPPLAEPAQGDLLTHAAAPAADASTPPVSGEAEVAEEDEVVKNKPGDAPTAG